MKKTTLSNCRALRLLATALLLLTVSVSANAYSFSAENDDEVTIYYNILSSSDRTCEVTYKSTSYNSYSGDVVIPETVTYSGITYTITSISSYAFYKCTGLTSVTIPNSVTKICVHGFDGCTGLTQIIIGEKVTLIAQYAFYNCSGLTSVTIPESVTSIDNYAFIGCSGLKDVTFEDGEETLTMTTSSSNTPFTNCPIETLYLGRNLSFSSSSYSAFRDNTSLTSLTIGEKVTNIRANTFYGCTGLTEVNFNATSCSSAGSSSGSAFDNCTGLSTINFGNNVTIIPDYIFYNCTWLKEVVILESVTSIGSSAFYNCSGLTGTLTIPNSVTEIGSYAFYGCTGLTGELTIPNSVTSIGSYAFYRCTGLTSVTIGNSVTTIGDYAFENFISLTEITIPSSVTSIGEQAFSGCTSLKTLTLENGEEALKMTTSSSNTPFTNCPIETVYLGRNLSFSNSSYSAFRNNTSLASLTIGEKVMNIPANTFYGCTGLKEVYFNATACTSAGSSSSNRAFYGCDNISTVNFGDKVTIIPAYLCYEMTGLTSVTIPDGITTINNYTFYGCSGLTSITIPENVTTIGDQAFRGCTGLTSVTIGNSVTTIGASSFYNCSKLTEIAIPESVTSIGNDAFSGCGGLWSISTSNTQTTFTFKVISNISGAESGIYYYYYGGSFYSVDDDGYYTRTGLTPGTNSSGYYFGIKLNNGSSSYHGNSISLTTTEINPQITQVSLTPESFTATGSYNAGDANVTATGFTGYTSDGVTLYLTNLEPKTKYTVEYYVTASGKKFTASTTFTTPAVEFTTLPAKATSNTVALLGATTNLSDDAVGAGFEWRRNDAPSTMPSNQAECPVIDGELTGTLNGLSATTYYDFRPYYTSQGGKTYYGDWITFITADAYVYFEPTVRTYSATSVGSESATVKAYAVAGSDNITSQGFEYWEGGSSSAMNVRRASTTDENGVTRVEVSGQWMTATLEDLEPSTTYSYRAYVTTAVGTTYGETMSFTTDVPTGIEGTRLTEDAEVYEIACYTLDGKKVSQPVRGINIVRYSDGTARKVLVK